MSDTDAFGWQSAVGKVSAPCPFAAPATEKEQKLCLPQEYIPVHVCPFLALLSQGQPALLIQTFERDHAALSAASKPSGFGKGKATSGSERLKSGPLIF